MFKKIPHQFLIDLGELEGDYRAFHLKDDIAQSFLPFLIAIVSALGMLRVDAIAYGDRPSLYGQLVLYRVGHVLVTLIFFLAIRNSKKVRTFDRLIFGWVAFTILFIVLNRFALPTNYLATAFDIIIPFAIYVLSPLRIAHNVVLSLVFSAGILCVEYVLKPGGDPVALNVAFAAQIIVQVLGLGSALQIQTYRRKSFKAYVQEKDAREMVAYLANIDPLTKSLTRGHFLNIAETEFLRFTRYRRPFSFLIIDADHFKKINDTYGHHAGDIALRSLSLVSMEQKRAQDTFGRLGGEEFGLLLPETNLRQACVVAERIQKVWEQSPVNLDGELIRSTVSIGVAEAVPADRSFEDMLRRADQMLYKAKEQGRNQVVAE
jgi:diguanylate cyclase (GGDEF)-like protein